jgi:hypothetical protein
MNHRSGLASTSDRGNWWEALIIIVGLILIFGEMFVDCTMETVRLHHTLPGSFTKNVSWVFERTVVLIMPWVRMTIITKFTIIDGLDGIGGR